ncbi:uncharacterized protein LOC110187733 [Drosophila serrata]|uniref:uncharacterized protein LOC110187733 n=1 Tax=Drosophila serrata TaxID=7274 RepID=UPI000A1D0849|nr:uncharacterized protein LOC110187733 [Drosophila serrata]
MNEDHIPEYCHYFKTLLVEELVLESDYRNLHYGQCSIVGRLRVAEHFRLENVRVRNLPEDCSLPEGALSLLLLGLTYDKATEQRVSNGCYCILRGEVVLCNVLRPNSPTLTTRGIHEQLASLGHDSLARQRHLSDLNLTHKPAIDVWFAQKIDSTDELLSHRLQIRRLINGDK